ncbi:hypothetical protein [Runella zeae]|uniref:hypothetical protein n=1 Tax=Runella zeae TaxID=94255 RepID=UPI00055FA364|nr:hypothetical protein [Runella zeae]
MKTTHLLTFLTVALLCGCNSNKTNTDEATLKDSTSAASVIAKSQTQCYALMTAQGDTITLTLTQQGLDVHGTLVYSLFEKDRNIGTLRGRMHADTLRADYTFESEGVESVREVVFLAKGENFVEGYGSTEETDNKTIFSPGAILTFDSEEVLKKTECKE